MVKYLVSLHVNMTLMLSFIFILFYINLAFIIHTSENVEEYSNSTTIPQNSLSILEAWYLF